MITGSSAERDLRFGFVMEQTLGHVTHYRNLRAAIHAEASVATTWYPLPFSPRGGLETIPPLRSNWSARASWRTWRTLSKTQAKHYDALFFHTQVSTLLCADLMRTVPSVISLDATPLNYDSVGAGYGHHQASGVAESVIGPIKGLLNWRSLHAAQAIVTWSDWARRSLIDDYGVSANRITVIAPGVDLCHWPRPEVRQKTGPIKVLFVGADYTRKGGDILLQACADLHVPVELHMVTRALPEQLPALPRAAHIYRDVAPNSALLKHLYEIADIFVLPTRADCFPLVIQEAMAAGLPVIATDVGAVGEAVDDGTTGIVVPMNDVDALRIAITRLADDPDLRLHLGRQGRLVAEKRFDCVANAERILNIMKDLARR